MKRKVLSIGHTFYHPRGVLARDHGSADQAQEGSHKNDREVVTNLGNDRWYCLWGHMDRFHSSLILHAETAEDLHSKGNWLANKGLR